MSNFRNQVQLIGNVGEDPKITLLDGDRKVANFPMATNEYYTNNQGEKVQNTDWHQIVAWGKTADILEKYTAKGSEIGVRGIYIPYRQSTGACTKRSWAYGTAWMSKALDRSRRTCG